MSLQMSSRKCLLLHSTNESPALKLHSDKVRDIPVRFNSAHKPETRVFIKTRKTDLPCSEQSDEAQILLPFPVTAPRKS
jgi:hypothetical protein